MQLGAEAVFVGSGIFKTDDPETRARAIVKATTHFRDPTSWRRSAGASVRRCRPRDRLRWRPRSPTGVGERRPPLTCRGLTGPTRPSEPPVPGGRRVGVLALQARTRSHARAPNASAPTPSRSDGRGARRRRRPRSCPGASRPPWRSSSSPRAVRTIEARIAAGMAVFGTCAGMILLADDVLTGGRRPAAPRGHRHLGAPQRLRPPGRLLRGRPRRHRPPRGAGARGLHPRSVVESVGPEVEVLARVEQGRPVACRQGKVIVTSFHPELSPDLRVHELFLRELAA